MSTSENRSENASALARIENVLLDTHEGCDVKLPREDVQALVDALRDSRRETQTVWRCSISDLVEGLDILRNRWNASRRKAEREAGAELGIVLDVLWDGRNPAPDDHASARTAGRAMTERVRQALMKKALISAMEPDVDSTGERH